MCSCCCLLVGYGSIGIKIISPLLPSLGERWICWGMTFPYPVILGNFDWILLLALLYSCLNSNLFIFKKCCCASQCYRGQRCTQYGYICIDIICTVFSGIHLKCRYNTPLNIIEKEIQSLVPVTSYPEIGQKPLFQSILAGDTSSHALLV